MAANLLAPQNVPLNLAQPTEAPTARRRKHWLRSPLTSLFHLLAEMIERKMGGTNDALHFLIDTSVGAFVDMLLFARMATRRRSLPKEAYHLARIVATQAADCGSCLQATVNIALRDGVRPEWLRAVVDRRPEALSAELKDVYEFVDHILRNTYQEDELRQVLRRRYGDRALVDLAFAVAAAKVSPYTKRVLGFGKSCSQVQVEVRA
jgi:alkylhydroperoxidase/carboxymuconolactone decarboxylase family protein YurZ